MKTSELTGPALDWAVAKCEGILEPIHGEPKPRVVFYSDEWQKYMRLNPPPQTYYSDRYAPSTDWSQGGPILQNHISELIDCGEYGWEACCNGTYGATGNTALEAVCKAYVASKLGDEIEIPEELKGACK